MKNIKLSIICLAYNQEPFIRECLNGFVMQKTNFPFEVLINDDASTDKTADIIREYEAKYPHLFRCVYQTENQWGKKEIGKDILFPMIRGQYVALCEGDDYWTDPLKLQKQVDFLDAHPDFSVCFHPVTVHYNDASLPDEIFPEDKYRLYKTELSLKDLLDHNFIQTNSVVYRWRFHQDSLDSIPSGILPADWFLHLLHAQTGKIAFLPDVMAVYRRNKGGIWTGMMKTEEWFEKSGLAYLRFLKEKQRVFLCDEEDTFLFTLMTFIQKIDCNKPLCEELKKTYSKEYDFIKQKKAVFLKYIFYSFLKMISFGKLKKRISKKKKLYKIIVKAKFRKNQ